VLRPPDIVDGGRGARYGFSELYRHLAEFTQGSINIIMCLGFCVAKTLLRSRTEYL
jgi:hypothetical protein